MTQCRVIGIEGPNGEPLNYILFSVYREDIRKLEEEIKKLKEENRKLSEGKIIYASEKEQRHYVDILEENKTLKEEIRNLKSDLDKFSEAYKKYRDYEKEELAESCYDLARENDRLKEEIGKLVMSKSKDN